MSVICGVDEAGRGPLAGPVFAAAVILDPNKSIQGLKDSKKLSPSQLASVYVDIMQYATEVSYATASVSEIDDINILQASLLAMKRAILKLSNTPDHVLIDGQYCPKIGHMSMSAVIKGDSKHQEISAASIIAKVERDKHMMELDRQFPFYNFKQHKGYPTKEHIRLIREHGVSDVHRKTFKPVSDLLI
jgi:ribonuclease HII